MKQLRTALTAFCLAALLSTSAVTAAQAASPDPAYVGTWAQDKAACGKDQAEDSAPMIMTATGYDQHEAHCAFSNIVEKKPGAWHVDTACTVEGSDENGALSFTVNGDTLALGEGDTIFTFSRCSN